MSKLDELIKELCPNGVEYKLLSDITIKFTDGMHTLPKDIRTIGDYPILSAQNVNKGKIDLCTTKYVMGDIFQKENNRTHVCKGDVLLTTVGAIGRVAVVKDNLRALFQRSVCVIKPDKNVIIPEYLGYILETTGIQSYMQVNAHGAAQKGLYLEQIGKLRFPVPPLKVQREIVRMLDSFSLFTEELIANLTVELTARKKQYEFYRNKMLTFDTKVTRKKLGEIFDFRNGLSKGKEFFGSGTPFIRYTDVYNHRSLRKEDITALVDCTPSELEKLRVSRGDVLFTRTSETAEDVGWSSVMLDDIGDCVFNGFTIKATPKTDDLLPEYCAYCFATDSFRNYVTTHCAFTTRAEYQIAIPSIDEQQRIANVLGNFEAICSDLNISLPAEIAARQKQYEYYRDKLLSFEEVK